MKRCIFARHQTAKPYDRSVRDPKIPIGPARPNSALSCPRFPPYEAFGRRPRAKPRALRTAGADVDRTFASALHIGGRTSWVFLSDTQDDPDRELAVVTALHQRRVDGVILAPSADPERSALTYLSNARLPCVLVDRTPDPTFDQVGVNNREAMQALVEHVAGLGHRRIGYVGGHPGLQTTLERIGGYRDSLERLGLTFDERYLVTGSNSTNSATSATHALLSLERPPSAIVAGNNMATIGAMRAIRACGLRVPQDISIVGFDDFEWADCFEPRLTLIAQPCEEIGRRAAILLMERIAAPNGPRRSLRLDARLIVRNSCGRPQ